ncbi:MAG: Glu-tRNA(Gln) amidotransferase subunit GatD [Desulfurococcaceae archaeon]
MLIYYGYTGSLAEHLAHKRIEPGDRILVRFRDGTTLEGILMPRPQLYESPRILVIKLENGYNVGIDVSRIESIELLGKRGEQKRGSRAPSMLTPGTLPYISLISTGGTIASKVDYETGAVTPALKPEEITEWIPEIGEIAVLSVREVMSIFSEDMTPALWEKIAVEVYRDVVSGVAGVVVAHGTDTMAYSAAALAFAVQNKPVPIVFVGAQRSSDRPSTDAATNLIAAILVAAKAPFAESVITMHASLSDEVMAVHRGVRARKMHTSRRDAFQSINDKPIALVNVVRREITITGKIYEYRGEKVPNLKAKFDEKVALVKFYPGMSSEIIDYLVDRGYHGIVLEGTGLGHVSNRLVDSIKRAVDSGIPVVMTSQCLFGRVNMYVYSTGRRLLEAGVIPGHDMLPETAYVKLSWILGSVTRDLKEVKRVMETNLVGELSERHTPDLYPRWPH